MVGNRGLFPDQLAKSGREEMIAVLSKAGYLAIALGAEDSMHRGVETRPEAARCAELFRNNRDAIDGIIITSEFR